MKSCIELLSDRLKKVMQERDDWKKTAIAIRQAVLQAEGVDFGPWDGFTANEYIEVSDEMDKELVK